MADNDLAIGRAVEAVSHSAFWDDTAFFILEDDAQNGAETVKLLAGKAVMVPADCGEAIMETAAGVSFVRCFAP